MPPRQHHITIRLSERENEILERINQFIGRINISEGVRFSLAHTFLDLVTKSVTSELKAEETVVILPTDLV